MSATTATITTHTTTEEHTRTTPLWRTGAVAGFAAALATTVVAAVALAADVPLEIEGEQILLLAFAQLTLLATAIGVGLAKALTRWATKPQRTFVLATVVLTALSFVPDLTLPMTTATTVVLITAHIVAAAIVIPALAKRLPANSR